MVRVGLGIGIRLATFDVYFNTIVLVISDGEHADEKCLTPSDVACMIALSDVKSNYFKHGFIRKLQMRLL